MVGLALLGAVLGVLAAYWATKGKRNFRRKLLAELEVHSRMGTVPDYVTGLLNFKAQWMKSLSIIRKPFSSGVNLTIETAALILTLMALVNALTNFERSFNGLGEGIAVVTLLGMIMAYIPSEWFFSGKIDAEMEGALRELKDVVEKGEWDAYIAEAKRSWA